MRSNVSEILPGVYIGNQFTAADYEFFVKNKIKKVVNCTPDVPFHFKWVKYMRINLNDANDSVNNSIMRANLVPAVRFIMTDGKPSRDNGVLIHCHAGISRSCTVGVALIRACCANDLDTATAMMLSKRPIAFFNGTFMNFRKALYDVFGH